MTGANVRQIYLGEIKEAAIVEEVYNSKKSNHNSKSSAGQPTAKPPKTGESILPPINLKRMRDSPMVIDHS